MFTAHIEARIGHKDMLIGHGTHANASIAINRAVKTAKQDAAKTYICRLSENGQEALSAFGATIQEAADEAKSMQRKAASGGGR